LTHTGISRKETTPFSLNYLTKNYNLDIHLRFLSYMTVLLMFHVVVF